MIFEYTKSKERSNCKKFIRVCYWSNSWYHSSYIRIGSNKASIFLSLTEMAVLVDLELKVTWVDMLLNIRKIASFIFHLVVY